MIELWLTVRTAGIDSDTGTEPDQPTTAAGSTTAGPEPTPRPE